ncbi:MULTISPECIES: alanine/glycine:cation symporter family protein [Cetobacterium]|jgi:AGCS family alanine or glycine:cation symporter|uniref:Alanine/glycine:cation symporter family protein n=1 Tax=Candidatus Cetobacterium colombiensis TaxID=3073100 RepID=A0ABU4W7I0_9FUSO|nr:alanine/glycine:cation symporter family protein [Candidatus Cetobacterium colombiensis]MDX8335194.1 alanine/glycine:cation symporter family protein [Candidatus Cetobacterium colombiensis]
MDIINSSVNFLNDILWGYVLIAMLLFIGTYFTLKTKFVQIRYFVQMIKILGDSVGHKGGVSSFKAFCISTASRVGTGNLAGVAIAIASGGPGAIFWMWLIAIIGGASSFVESTLAQIYKVKDGEAFRGGPAYYMEKALNKRWMGVAFSILISITFGLIFNSVQSNTISLAFHEAFKLDRTIIGVALAIATGAIIFGGVQRIANFSAAVVPVMATLYILVSMYVIITNISMVPEVFRDIIENAFGIRQAVGGGIGAAIMTGVKRGLFSNEAGMGSAPNAAAAAETSHPVKQGFVQTLGVFTDTILICSCTAFMVLISGAHKTEGLTGIQLTQNALSSQVGGWGNVFIALCILLFAFSSIIGNYYYGETNIEFLTPNKMWLNLYRFGVIGMVMFGSIGELALVWNMADLFMGLMAVLNLIAIFLLGKVAFEALKDYSNQKENGLDPSFNKNDIDMPFEERVECWD